MNRFLNKKKGLEPLTANEDALSALSSQNTEPSPGLKKSATSRWKRGKKQIEAKPELNLTAALPAVDDFRTSLLMPNLSARFSMLREQDDPNSLLGKAADDSVLQPRRRSRMDFGGLGDIAEVSSIKSQKSQVRPPYAYGRQDSFASDDGYGSENDSTCNGSVMSRARPGEGNVLFGGRQKVYMIPKAGASSNRSLGKVRYEDDIGTSAFQKFKQRERELQGRTSDESQGFDFGLDSAGSGYQDYKNAPTPNDSAKDLSHSPSLTSSERKRSTNSTSHSEERSSTAATSVASQPTNAPAVQTQPAPSTAPSTLKRQDTKTRRLYEQGLDQHIHEQQTSALTRLNSIQRQRTHTGGKQAPPILQSTKSASNLHEKARRPVYALRPQSPEAIPPLMSSFSSMRKLDTNNSSPNISGPQSPLTPTGPDWDENNSALTQALEPADRGKATAMGAFNKPQHSFDEQQYLERQRQLQRSASTAAVRRENTAPSMAAQQQMGRFDMEPERFDSDGYTGVGSRPATKNNEPTNAYNVFQRAAQMNAAPGAQQFDKPALPDTHRTFFGDISASDSEDDNDEMPPYYPQAFNQPDYGYSPPHGRWQPTILSSVSEHPALRSQKSKASLAEEDEDIEPLPLQSNQSMQQGDMRVTNAEEDFQSPSLQPNDNATPLNGLMQHLRQRSDQSSIFPPSDRPTPDEVPEMPEWNPKNFDLIKRPFRNTLDSDSRIGSTYTSSNPWDLDEMENRDRGEDQTNRPSVSPVDEQRSYVILDGRAPSRSAFQSRQSEVSDLDPQPDHEDENSWQNELRKQHTRDTSTATQQEREAFENELAARRNAVQESIKRNATSRNVSPAPSASGGIKDRAFGMLRSRSSRESVDSGQRMQAPPKAMKMLGITGSGPNASSNSLNSQFERSGYSIDISRQRDESASKRRAPFEPPRVPQQSEQIARKELQGRSRENSETGPVGQQQTPQSRASSAGGRSRANSEATTGRARSRTGPYRDDLEKAMMEGTGSSAAGVPDLSPMIPHELTPRPSPDVIQGQFDAGRARSNSKPGMTNYFDQRSLQPSQTGSRERLSPAVPSPATLSPTVFTPGSTTSARSAPTVPFAQNMTPPLSGANTPVSSTFTPPPQIPPSSNRPNGILRKKTIAKTAISEPTLVSSTSTIDTVELPEGASLKNGMDEPPPLPPINPRRRATKALFGLGSRKDSDESASTFGPRSKTPDPWMGTRPVEPDFAMEAARGNRSGSETRSPRMPGGKQSLEYSAAMRQQGFAPSTGSPERMGRPTPSPQPVAMNGIEGGMF